MLMYVNQVLCTATQLFLSKVYLSGELSPTAEHTFAVSSSHRVPGGVYWSRDHRCCSRVSGTLLQYWHWQLSNALEGLDGEEIGCGAIRNSSAQRGLFFWQRAAWEGSSFWTQPASEGGLLETESGS